MNLQKIPTRHSNTVNYGNRGMSLESDINASNEYYLINDIAVIYKKPTPITVSKVLYPSRGEAVIKEAYYRTPSTTDYNGLYQGKYIDFEAKETKNKTCFPLSNLHCHQIEHLKKIEKHGGISFLIVRFVIQNETYMLLTKDLMRFLEESERKSIPYDFFKTEGYLIKDQYLPRVPYLETIQKIYFGGKK